MIVVPNKDAVKVRKLLAKGKHILEVAHQLGYGINVSYMPDGEPIEELVKAIEVNGETFFKV